MRINKAKTFIAMLLTLTISYTLLAPSSTVHSAGGTDTPDPGKTKSGYTLIWSDEFDGNYGSATVDENGLNRDNWDYQYGDGTIDSGNTKWGNGELQSYTKKSDNIKVENGELRITAKRESSSYTDGVNTESGSNFTSARIRTSKKVANRLEPMFSLTYGYVEARIKTPNVTGTWPAFWMLPVSDEIYGKWPVSGEIDIMEAAGVRPEQASGALHWGSPNRMTSASGFKTMSTEAVGSPLYHVYAVNWEPGKIEWIYDGQVVHSIDSWGAMEENASDKLTFDAPFDQPFYLLLNMAVDNGSFGQDGANKNIPAADYNSSDMYVDYVRCYQKDNGYPKVAVPGIDANQKHDWADYKGINLVSDLGEPDVLSLGALLDDASLAGEGLKKWYLSTYDTGVSVSPGLVTVSVEEQTHDGVTKNWTKVQVSRATGQEYNVQLINHFKAEKGYTYRVCFDAYASESLKGKEMTVDAKRYTDWKAFEVYKVRLKNKPTHYAFLIDQEEDFDKTRLEFNMGALGVGDFYLSNVRVEIINPEDRIDTTAERRILDGGEFIYNSSFDQGIMRTNYWKGLNGTTIFVPNYTYNDLSGYDKKVLDVASITNYEKVPTGIKYYERRAQISAPEGQAPTIVQSGVTVPIGKYSVAFDLYCETETAVRVSLSSNGQTIGERIYAYHPESKVRTYSFIFESEHNYENVDVVFEFAHDTKVELDNCHMKGITNEFPIEEHPMNASTTWTADNGNGGSLSVTESNNEYTLTDLTVVNPGLWYSPQLVSSKFSIYSGYTYKMSFDYKLESNGDNTFEYILQKAGTPWTIVRGVETVNCNATRAAGDGFIHYEVLFTSRASVINDCHLVFGFGNTKSTGGSFTVRNFAIDLLFVLNPNDLLLEDDSNTVDMNLFKPVVKPVPDDESGDNTDEAPDDETDREEGSVPGDSVGTGLNQKPKPPVQNVDTQKDKSDEAGNIDKTDAAGSGNSINVDKKDKDNKKDDIESTDKVEKPSKDKTNSYAEEVAGKEPEREVKNFGINLICCLLFLLLLILICYVIYRIIMKKNHPDKKVEK